MAYYPPLRLIIQLHEQIITDIITAYQVGDGRALPGRSVSHPMLLLIISIRQTNINTAHEER